MRLVQVMVPAGKREAVIDVLDGEGVDYALTDETSGREYTAVVTFPLPAEAVEPVLESLREAGLERDAYTVVVAAETVVSDRFEALQEEYEREEDSDDRIAREELAARARDLSPRWRTFLAMTVISAVVATAGVLLDSPAVVVGSMVIAPLVGPAMATSVGSVLDDAALFRRGVKLQVVGGVLAVASAAGFALLLRTAKVVPLGAAEVFAIGEVEERLAPDVLSLAIALGAGAAGALSLSSGVSTALVGVMIAAALVPPTAVIGIGLAWGRPAAVVGSTVLVAVNILSINFVALAVLWYKGYRPELWFREDEARAATLKRLGALAAVLLALSGFLAGVTVDAYGTATFEDRARSEVRAELATHGDLRALETRIEYGSGFPFRQPRRVVVTVGHPRGVDPPPLAGALERRLEGVPAGPLELGGTADPAVEVRYVAVDTAGRTAEARSPAATPRTPGPRVGQTGV